MAVVEMQRISLCGLNKDREEILARLQALGVVQIEFRKSDAKKLKKYRAADTSDQRQEFERQIQHAESALEILDRYAPEQTSLLDSLAGKALIRKNEMEEVEKTRGQCMETAEDLIDSEKRISEYRSEIARLQNQRESLLPWMNLDIPMNSTGTGRTRVLIGTFSDEVTEENVLTFLKTGKPAVEAADVEIISQDKDQTCLAVICLNEDAAAAEEALRANGFSKPTFLPPDTPLKEGDRLQEEIQSLEAKVDAEKEQIAALSDKRSMLKILADDGRIQSERSEISGQLPQTKKVFALSGYVPADCAEGLKEELTRDFVAEVEIEKIGAKEKPPVMLKNNPFSRCVQGLTASYGLPSKNDIDPTFLMSFFYIVFFGMMLSDAGYGLLIVIFCAFVVIKFPRMDPGLRQSFKMFLWCGCSTVFWGLMFGGFFGDLITVVADVFFGKDVTIPALWYTPLDDPMRLLMVCLVFGLIHLFLGFGIKGYMLLKKHDVIGFLCDIVAWYAFLIGLILMLLPTEIFYSISNIEFNFGPVISNLAIALALIGAVVILVMSGRRKKKKIGIRLALGLYDLYGITTWLSDILSYSRLLALGLATGVIAQVINQMGSMLGSGIIGIIFFIIVFLIGTALNMAINILGAYVHTNRLQYVEFFGKFYETGGRPFEPFTKRTKYVDIQEES